MNCYKTTLLTVGLLILWAMGCGDDPVTEQTEDEAVELCTQLGMDCSDTPDEPTVGEPVFLVPSDALPSEVDVQDANNNLDVVEHDGRVYLAFRSAPNHFASEDVVMWVVSTADHQTWDLEASFDMDTDLREPRFLSFNGRLFLYFAVLGTEMISFEPHETRVSERLGAGNWSESETIFEEGFIPWRIHQFDGVPYLLGYVGGENIYQEHGEPIQVKWLTTNDGLEWTPVVDGQETVLEGGVSETDFTFLDDGTLIAVGRNEAGDDDGFGSKICRAEADDLGNWQCETDRKKYDSPLVFSHGGHVYLIGRRNVTDTGYYDLGHGAGLQDQFLDYQLDYWRRPKRCSLWEVDPEDLTVSLVLDLPSRGDTCFASILPLDANHYAVYNYTSPLDGDDLGWSDGQTGPTSIYSLVLGVP